MVICFGEREGGEIIRELSSWGGITNISGSGYEWVSALQFKGSRFRHLPRALGPDCLTFKGSEGDSAWERGKGMTLLRRGVLFSMATRRN